MLYLEDVTIGYARRPPLLAGLRLQLPAARLVALLAPNGAGKSTLIRVMAGLQKPLRGNIWIGKQLLHDMPLEQRARHISIVLAQQPRLVYLRVIEIVSMPLLSSRWIGLAQSHLSKAYDALRLCEIEHLAQAPYGQLSDGQKQRVMLARALAQQTPLILLDEPTTFLDLRTRHRFMFSLQQLVEKHQKTILFSTHDIGLAMQYSDLMWVITPKAKLLSGSPEELACKGAVTELFAEDGFRLELPAGRYLSITPVGYYYLQSDCPDIGYWTAHLLERKGWQPANNPSDTHLHIQYKQVAGWHITTNSHTQTCHDWQQLQAYLQAYTAKKQTKQA